MTTRFPKPVTLRQAKRERYGDALMRVRQRIRDAGLTQEEVAQAVAAQGACGLSMARKVLSGRRVSERVLRWCSGAERHLRRRRGVPEWL